MNQKKTQDFISNVLDSMPSDWLKLTTHRLDIYNEKKAKVEFLEEFEKLSSDNLKDGLQNLPTSFDYIRLGHPLSCVLEWAVAKSKAFDVENVISFSSETMPILAVLRKNLLEGINTQITFDSKLPNSFNEEILNNVYGYNFTLTRFEDRDLAFKGSTILLTEFNNIWNSDLDLTADFIIAYDTKLGSITLVNKEENNKYISEIQHVRRRESIAMTPHDSLKVLEAFTQGEMIKNDSIDNENKALALKTINDITNTSNEASLASCGLSIQYAITMGLIHHAMDKNPGKEVKIIVPPNCYGGTNDQARRVAACIKNVEVLDLPVDSGRDMVSSVQKVLDEVAAIDAIPFIIAEIPTNPRVEVPDLEKLKSTLMQERKTSTGLEAIAPVFILDQTFCPNVKFLGENDYLSDVKTISYVSGSKFPSGGLCTAGYCVANDKASELMSYIEKHLTLCGNTATDLQVELLATQMPSMLKRIEGAYKNTREFVDHIMKTLPQAKINFVSRELAADGFTPSVFSLDLPAKNEEHKRELNLKLIDLMIEDIPHESKHCVSYGQLQGCYWTIPATSTQGTTKEGDKDYIVRVSMSVDLDIDLHKKTFSKFCNQYIKNS